MGTTQLHPRETLQERLASLLRWDRGVYFCDACLALKMGEFPRDIRLALAGLESRGAGIQVAAGQCSECLQATSVVRVRAA